MLSVSIAESALLANVAAAATVGGSGAYSARRVMCHVRAREVVVVMRSDKNVLRVLFPNG